MAKTNYKSNTQGRRSKSSNRDYKPKGVNLRDHGKDITDIVSNDPSYYNKYPVEYDLATRFPWFKIIGDEIDLRTTVTSVYSSGAEEIDKMSPSRFPGIMRINYIPGIGATSEPNDAVNRAYAQLMAMLYAKTTGANLGFQQADIAMLQISMTSIASLIATARRALSCVDFWIAKNKFYPRALLNSMGFSWNDLTTNRASYITRLNAIIHQFNSIKMPSILDVFNRQFALCNNIYVDEDSAFGQIYYFMPEGYFEYSDTEMKCKFVPFSNDATFEASSMNEVKAFGNFGEYLDLIASLLDKWYGSSDLYQINGAILRCFPEAPTLHIPDCTLADSINPVTDKYIMLQIMNMDIVDTTNFVRESFDVTQDPIKNVVIWRPCANVISGVKNPTSVSDSKFLRTFDAVPTADDNCEMTRFCVTARIPDNDEERQYIDSCGTEIVTRVQIFNISGIIDDQTEVILTLRSNADALFGNAKWSSYEIAGKISPFRYIPYLPVDPNQVGTLLPLGDLYNYTVVDRNVIRSVNDMCMLSLWKVNL